MNTEMKVSPTKHLPQSPWIVPENLRYAILLSKIKMASQEETPVIKLLVQNAAYRLKRLASLTVKALSQIFLSSHLQIPIRGNLLLISKLTKAIPNHLSMGKNSL